MDKDDPAKSKFNDQFDKYLDEISRIREEEDKEEKRKILKILEKHFERQNKTINTFCSEMTTSNALVLNQLKSVINKEEDVTDAVEESKPGTSGTSSVSDTGPTISDTDISPERKKFRPAIGSPRKVWYCNPCRKSINIKSRASHLISATHIRLSTLLQNVTSSSKTDKQQSPKKD